jgi:cytosine/creatinine deaminase
MPLTEQDQKFLAVAISEAQKGFDEGGIPIGASLVSKDGTLLAQGHNMRMQKYAQIPSAIRFGGY